MSVQDADGTVRLINLKAASLLGPLPTEGGGERGPSLMRLTGEIGSLLASVDGRPVGCARSGDGRPLSLRIEPQEAADGERLFAIEIEEDSAEAGRDDFKRRGLTCREIEVAQLAALGRSNAEIGLALHISEETVKVHLKRIYAKLGVRTRAALIARWHGAAGLGDAGEKAETGSAKAGEPGTRLASWS